MPRNSQGAVNTLESRYDKEPEGQCPEKVNRVYVQVQWFWGQNLLFSKLCCLEILMSKTQVNSLEHFSASCLPVLLLFLPPSFSASCFLLCFLLPSSFFPLFIFSPPSPLPFSLPSSFPFLLIQSRLEMSSEVWILFHHLILTPPCGLRSITLTISRTCLWSQSEVPVEVLCSSLPLCSELESLNLCGSITPLLLWDNQAFCCLTSKVP